MIYNKISFLELIEFTTEDLFPKHTIISTKLKRKLFTEVIRGLSKEACIALNRV